MNKNIVQVKISIQIWFQQLQEIAITLQTPVMTNDRKGLNQNPLSNLGLGFFG